MINNVKVTNIDLNQSITLNRFGESPFVIDEINWGLPPLSQEDYRVPFQIGRTYTGLSIGVRDVNITGYVIADSGKLKKKSRTWGEYLKQQEDEIFENKQKMLSVFKPYNELKLNAEGHDLFVRLSEVPRFSENEEENNEVLCRFEVDVRAYNPMFFKDDTKMVGLSSDKKSAAVTNSGDIDTGLTITLKAVGGAVKDFKFVNEDSSEFIEISGITLNNGDVITIKTEVGKESVTLLRSGQYKSVSLVGQLTSESTFLQLKRGTNTYSFSVTSGLAYARVAMTCSEQFYYLKEM